MKKFMCSLDSHEVKEVDIISEREKTFSMQIERWGGVVTQTFLKSARPLFNTFAEAKQAIILHLETKVKATTIVLERQKAQLNRAKEL